MQGTGRNGSLAVLRAKSTQDRSHALYSSASPGCLHSPVAKPHPSHRLVSPLSARKMVCVLCALFLSLRPFHAPPCYDRKQLTKYQQTKSEVKEIEGPGLVEERSAKTTNRKSAEQHFAAAAGTKDIRQEKFAWTELRPALLANHTQR